MRDPNPTLRATETRKVLIRLQGQNDENYFAEDEIDVRKPIEDDIPLAMRALID